MKSRVINTKHFEESPNGYIGYTSKLKPSLFYGNKDIEGYLYVQNFDTNKMSKWILSEEKMNDGKIVYWIYVPDNKSLKNFPELENKKLIVHFDSRAIKNMARKKYNRITQERKS